MGSLSNCRFYENQFPAIDELVVVQVRQIAEMGAYVKLLEYDNIEGMILLSELSRRRIRSINKLIRVGRNEVVVVLRVDQEKGRIHRLIKDYTLTHLGYIDLSKRRVSPEDVVKCEERFNKSKAVHSIMRNVAEKTNVPLEELYTAIGWPLYRKYGHAYDAFKIAISYTQFLKFSNSRQSDNVFSGLKMPNPAVLPALLAQISRRLTPQPAKIRADIEVTCFSYDGIDAIKTALLQGEKMSTEQCPIKVKLVAPPLYVVVANTLDKEIGLATVKSGVNKIREVVESFGGELAIKMEVLPILFCILMSACGCI
jgi:translation initiation factor 2 subunit 1